MKSKHLAPLATVTALALAGLSGTANAALVIDPTGLGGTGGHVIVTDTAQNIGSSIGDMLLKSLVNQKNGGEVSGPTSTGTGTVYAHSVFGLPSGLGLPGEITFTLQMAATSTLDYTNPSTSQHSESLTLAEADPPSSIFNLYFDPLDSLNSDSGLAANHDTGAGYNDGILLATGNVTIRPSTSGLSQFFIDSAFKASTKPLVALDGEFDGVASPCTSTTTDGCTLTESISGSQFLEVDIAFADQDTSGYLLNNISSASLDIGINNAAITPYADVFASDVVGATRAFDGSAAKNYGVSTAGASLDAGGDGINNLFCGNKDTGPCSVQFQLGSTTLRINGAVPEPGTLALLGIGFGLIGFASRKRKLS